MKNHVRKTGPTLLLILVILTPVYGQNFETKKVSDNIYLVMISENAWVHVSYSTLPGYGRFSSNGLVFINGSEAFLFDSPVNDSLTINLVSWLQDSMGLKIKGFVPNHWHNDCMGGLAYIQSLGIPSYASEVTIEIARSKMLPVPETGFKDSLLIHLGDKIIECYYPGPAHSYDNIAVWIPSEQILFAGCMVKSIDALNMGNTADGDMEAYPLTIEKVFKRYPSARFVIPGHGQFGGIELLKHTLELLNH